MDSYKHIDIENSFFKHANMVNFNSIKHNLHDWHFNIEGWDNNAGMIETYIIAPYSEMKLQFIENYRDVNFFNKPTLRIKISFNKDTQNYIFPEKIKCSFKEKIKFILIDTEFIYPHNWFYFYNRDYLINKMVYSIEYTHNFISGYKDLFPDEVPFMYILNISENAQQYIFNIIIKEYLDIYYLSTDMNNNIIRMNLMIDLDHYNNRSYIMKYKKISVIIPRLIKDKQMSFRFSASTA